MSDRLPDPNAAEIEAARASAPDAFATGYRAGFADAQATHERSLARLGAELALARRVLRHQETVRASSSPESMTGWALNFLRRAHWYREAVDRLLRSEADDGDDPAPEGGGPAAR
jgi:hypothetical protein